MIFYKIQKQKSFRNDENRVKMYKNVFITAGKRMISLL